MLERDKQKLTMNDKEILKYVKRRLQSQKISCIKKIKGDASNRIYYRAKDNKKKLIIMDSELEKRNFNNFIKYSKIFKKNRLEIPKIYEIDIKKRIIILEDVGNNLIFDKASKNNFNKIYENAVLNILEIQKIKDRSIRNYKEEKYHSESQLFVEWVLEKYLNIKITNKDKKEFSKSLNYIIKAIDKKDKKLVHRDYHSKNLFFKNNNIIIIDYQDAVYGSPLYDLVSLLNDCYVDINEQKKDKFKKLFFTNFNDLNKFTLSYDEFLNNFNYVSVQRHMKASGIFCRLSIKYNRHNYLQFLNRTFNYIINSSNNYSKLKIINFYAKEAINKINESNYSSSRQR